MKNLHKIAFLLLVIGGLNWLLVGLFQWGIGDLFGGDGFLISRAIYLLVGISAIFELTTHKDSCRYCGISESIQ